MYIKVYTTRTPNIFSYIKKGMRRTKFYELKSYICQAARLHGVSTCGVMEQEHALSLMCTMRTHAVQMCGVARRRVFCLWHRTKKRFCSSKRIHVKWHVIIYNTKSLNLFIHEVCETNKSYLALTRAGAM